MLTSPRGLVACLLLVAGCGSATQDGSAPASPDTAIGDASGAPPTDASTGTPADGTVPADASDRGDTADPGDAMQGDALGSDAGGAMDATSDTDVEGTDDAHGGPGDATAADTTSPCVGSAACDDGDGCTVDTCDGGVCSHAPLLCDDGDPCTADFCDDGACAAQLAPSGPQCCYEGVLHQASFEGTSTDGFLVVNLAEGGEPPIVWQPHVGRAHDGAGSLYLGDPTTMTFANGGVVKASATTKPIALPAGRPIELSLWALLSVEEGKSWDVLTVAVIVDGALVPVWAKGSDTPLDTWFRVRVDLSAFANEIVQVVLAFDSVDETLNDGEGVYVDDLRLLALCAAPPCAGADSCDDGLACTDDSCVAGACSWGISPLCCISDADCDDGDVCTIDLCDPVGGCGHVPVGNPLCCNEAADCDDANACTTDSCAGGECKHSITPDAGCCAKVADCDDADPCTVDSCDAYQCGHVDTCCQSDAACDDGDDVCTIDSCTAGACTYAPTGADGCCDAVPASWTFDAGEDGWTFSNSAGPDKGFQVWTGSPQVKSPPGVLYYGDPLVGSFNFGDTLGSATSPPVTLDAPGAVTLAFEAFFDTEDSGYFDVLRVDVVPEDGGGPAEVWAKDYGNVKIGAWTVAVADLSAWAGHTVRVRFRFDTGDGSGNGGLGVVIDNVVLTNTCVPKGCETALDCKDGVGVTTEACEGGACTYEAP